MSVELKTIVNSVEVRTSSVNKVEVATIGKQGPKGDGGRDAYELAVLHGFQGDYETWYESMKVKGDKGEQGDPAPDVLAQYSVDAEVWDDEYNEDVEYIRFSYDGGESYGHALKFMGPEGQRGPTGPEVEFQYSADGAVWNDFYTHGDFYVRMSTDEGDTWGSALIIRGIQGIQGIQGEKGPQGVQGPQGIQGEKGPQGIGVPEISPGDADKVLKVKGDESDTEWNFLPDATTATKGISVIPPAYYFRSERPFRVSADTLSLPDIVAEVSGELVQVAASDVLLNVETSWDSATYTTPATRKGLDFYIYLTADGIILSANSTYPSGYDANNSRKIGGFHCLCANVGSIAGHPLSNFVAGDILPESIWDLEHRPRCSPEGMVYSPEANIWVDIYLQSGTGQNTASAYGGSVTASRDWMDFTDDLGTVKKRMLNDPEFQLIAEGSNQKTNIAGSADPGTTGGHVDTAGRRMVSNIGCEDCAGAYYQWLSDQSYRFVTTTTSYNWYELPGNKGSLYNQSSNGSADVKLRAGGYWATGSYCGSRCRDANYSRWHANTAVGVRGAAEPV